jgi:hypothetical protein
LPENEAFISTLAKQIGLPVVDIRLLKTERGSMGVIARYDRQFMDGRWRRVHQEDFCQAIGISAARSTKRKEAPVCSNGLTSFGSRLRCRWSICKSYYTGHCSIYWLATPMHMEKIYRCSTAEQAWDPDLVTTKHLEALALDLGFRPKLVTDQAAELV